MQAYLHVERNTDYSICICRSGVVRVKCTTVVSLLRDHLMYIVPLMKDHLSFKTTIFQNQRVVSKEGHYFFFF